MQPVIKNLPLRSQELPDETSGRANLEAWHGQIHRPLSTWAVIGYLIGGTLFATGLLTFLINR